MLRPADQIVTASVAIAAARRSGRLRPDSPRCYGSGMSLEKLFALDPGQVRPADFDGRYDFRHDGWPGTLLLRYTGSRNLQGSYHDDRTNADYRVTAKIDIRAPNRIDLTIRDDFNWVGEQRFVGYLSTGDKQVIAGQTFWKDIPFGFVAGKTELFAAGGAFRPGEVEPADILAEYELHADGRSARLALTEADGRRLSGHCTVGGETAAVFGEVGEGPGHEIVLTVAASPAARATIAARLTGYLFSRTKDVVAGWVNVGSAKAGFYLRKRL
jgi:hypothetical protein